jgi:transposase
MDTNTAGGEVKAALPARKRRVYRSHSLEEKRRIVLECLTSGDSVSIVARRHDMNANQLFHWRKQHARGQLGPMMLPSAPLLAVRVEESEAVERPSARAVAPVPEANWIEIECTRPYRVRVYGGVDRAALVSVLEILSAR